MFLQILPQEWDDVKLLHLVVLGTEIQSFWIEYFLLHHPKNNKFNDNFFPK
jgi:hypothetical protein